jgi:hypothetical protein
MPHAPQVYDSAALSLAEARLKRRMALTRRRFERHPLRLPVTVAWDGRRYATTTRTLALGGLFVPHPEPPPPGTRVTVALTLTTAEETEELSLSGEVVYSTGDGMAIKFVDVPPAARGRLRAFFLFHELHCYNTENPEI